MLSPQEKKDKSIRATDLDALSCRHCANAKGYFVPPDLYIQDLLRSYEHNLQHCRGYTALSAGRTLRTLFKDPKYPLINRGTFFRTKLINTIVERFISSHDDCQIISLGGGSDTRGFRVLQEHLRGVRYAEIDFTELAKIKKAAIFLNPTIQGIVGVESENMSIKDRASFEALDPEIHTSKYDLIALDLRKIEEHGSENILRYVDQERPTLVISECVLCYLTPEDNEKVLGFCKSNFRNLAVLMYEPMGLEDAFGQTMEQNLISRGIDLHTFKKYPDLKSRELFFNQTLGFGTVKSTDLAEVGGYTSNNLSWLLKDEVARVTRIEMIDEVEEISLLLQHYCLIFAQTGKVPEEILDLKWLY